MTKYKRTCGKPKAMRILHNGTPHPIPHPRNVKRVAAYCRVSTFLDEQEMSFETQRDYYTNLINGDPTMVLAGIYGDQGLSGLHSENRQAFQQLMTDCEEGRIDLILVKSISRFSRNAVECIGYLQKLKKLGVTVIFEKEGLNSLDKRTEMILSIHAAIAQNESCSLSESVRWAKRRGAEVGEPSRSACYGYCIDRTEAGSPIRKWAICGEQAKRIRLLFDLAHELYTIKEIMTILNEYEKRNGGEENWTRGRVSYALRQEAYKGDILTNKTVVTDYLKNRHVKNNGITDQFYIEQHHEPIVDKALFDAVQEYYRLGLLNARNKRKREEWMKRHGKDFLHGEKTMVKKEVQPS